MHPRIRIHTKISWIRNIGFLEEALRLQILTKPHKIEFLAGAETFFGLRIRAGIP
jgi:hypothetical protein